MFYLMLAEGLVFEGFVQVVSVVEGVWFMSLRDIRG